MRRRATLWLLSYDITDDRIRNRVARFLKKHGIRIQYSVFVILDKTSTVNEIAQAVAELIDSRQDDVRIYPISASGKSVMMGSTSVPPQFLPQHPAFQQLRLPLEVRHSVRAASRNDRPSD